MYRFFFLSFSHCAFPSLLCVSDGVFLCVFPSLVYFWRSLSLSLLLTHSLSLLSIFLSGVSNGRFRPCSAMLYNFVLKLVWKTYIPFLHLLKETNYISNDSPLWMKATQIDFLCYPISSNGLVCLLNSNIQYQ